MKIKSIYPLGIIISLIFLVVYLFTLKDYGLATDSVIHFLRGQAYFHLFTTGQSTFDNSKNFSPILIAPAQRISNFRANAWELTDNFSEEALNLIGKQTPPKLSIQNLGNKAIRDSFYKSNYWNAEMFKVTETDGHPPTSDILTAASNNIFYEKLGLLPDIEAYNLWAVITGALGIYLVYYFAHRNFGQLTAVISSVSLALYPFFFSEAHFNIKDVPEMAFFTGIIISFYFWVFSNKRKWFLAFLLFSILAIGTKLNGVFIPLILIPWLISLKNKKQFKTWFGPKLIVYLTVFLAVNSFVFVVTWPALWVSTLSKIGDILSFYKDIGTSELVGYSPLKTIFGINLLGILLVVSTMPIVIIPAFIAGVVDSFKKTNPPKLLVLLWFLVSIARTVIPGFSVYASLRQFLEFLPAEAIIVGIGGAWIIQKLELKTSPFAKALGGKKDYGKVLGFLACILILIYLIGINISYHPNENLYFNELVGGTAGALQKRLLVTWQTPNDQEQRQAVDWLNEHAEQNSKLAFLDGSNFSVSPLWLRPDIKFGSYLTGLKFGGEYIISINYYPIPPSSISYAAAERFLEPVHELKVHGATILKIWKNDKRYLKKQYKKAFN